MKKWKPLFWILSAIFLIALIFVLYGQVHIYEDATCVSPAKCKLCGDTRGVKLEHQWNAATCTSPQTCKRCGVTSGNKLQHVFSDATCTSPQTCKRCGITSGNKLQHILSDATCTLPQICARCNAAVGTALGHKWTEATCQSPKTCTRCFQTTGSVAAHEYSMATCTSAAHCRFCGITKGAPKEHSYYGGKCLDCGKKDANFLVFTQKNDDISYKILGIPQSSIAVTDISYDVSGSTLCIYLTIKKTFDLLGKNYQERCYFAWTLYTSSGVVVKSGEQETIELRKGDIVDDYCIKITGLDMSKKSKFKLFPFELFD